MQCYINRSVHGGESVRSTRQTIDFLSASYFCVIFISTFLTHVNFVAIIVYLQTTVVEGKKRTETRQQRGKCKKEAVFPSIPPHNKIVWCGCGVGPNRANLRTGASYTHLNSDRTTRKTPRCCYSTHLAL